MLVDWLETIIPTKDPIRMFKSRESKWGASFDTMNFKSFRPSKYICVSWSARICRIRIEIGSKSCLALFPFRLMVYFVSIFLISTIAFVFFFFDDELRCSKVWEPNNCRSESGWYWSETLTLFSADFSSSSFSVSLIPHFLFALSTKSFTNCFLCPIN